MVERTYRVVIADTAALRLAAAGRVRDGRRGAARVRRQDSVDQAQRGAVAWGGGRLAGAKDVDARAVLADVDGAGAGQRRGREEESRE